jgi:phage/plasmid-like protein (TIGR03299 family)
MPANLDSMMFVRGDGIPWHGQGISVETAQTAEAAIMLAGLNWTVSARDLFTRTDHPSVPSSLAVPEAKAVVKDDTNEILGVVGAKYKPIQNAEAFGFFDSIVGEGKAIYHTAGSLLKHRRVWMLAKLPEDIKFESSVTHKEDLLKKYLLLATSHDGTLALKMFFTPIRVVCNNTLNVALNGMADGISIRHTSNATQKVREAQKALGIAQRYFEKFSTLTKILADTPFTSRQMKNLTELILPSEPGDEATKTQNIRNSIYSLWDGRGRGIEDFRGTAWAAFNAVTEYADFYKPVRGEEQEERKLASIWFGTAANLKQKALDIIKQQIHVVA